MSPKQIRGQEVSTSRISDDPKEAETSSIASINSGDSLLCQVEEYVEGSVTTPQPNELILIDDEDDGLRVGPFEGLGYGVVSTSGISRMVTDVNPSKIKPWVTMKVFRDTGIDANNFYLIIPTPNDRAHNSPANHMTVYTRSLSFG